MKTSIILGSRILQIFLSYDVYGLEAGDEILEGAGCQIKMMAGFEEILVDGPLN